MLRFAALALTLGAVIIGLVYGVIFPARAEQEALSNRSSDKTDDIAKKPISEFKKQKCQESDLFCKTPDLAEKYGYPVETHNVISRDGFILTAHRITQGRSRKGEPPPRKRLSSGFGRPPVILAHALLCSSSDWLMNVPDKALGYMLADAGLDVWMLNSRGNSYSSGHRFYNESQSEYWDWSFHEMGTLDIPAWIDYILEVTRHDYLYFVGHSMGSTQFFIGLSERPEYNRKVRKMFALAPAVYLTHSRYWPLAQLAPMYTAYIQWRGSSQFVPERFRTWMNIFGFGCPTVEPFCDHMIYFVVGANPKQTNSTQTAIIVSHTPDNVSSKTISHFLQIMRADRFQNYDYGSLDNGILYNGETTPPEYNLTRVTTPVVIFHSENDVFAKPVDVGKCAKILGNVQEVNLIPDKQFTHIDFTYAIDTDKLLNNRIVDIIVADEEASAKKIS